MPRHQVVAGLLVADGAFLLALRSADRPWFPGAWDLPGGHVEPGEHPRDALGLRLADSHLLPVVEQVLAAGPGAHALVE